MPAIIMQKLLVVNQRISMSDFQSESRNTRVCLNQDLQDKQDFQDKRLVFQCYFAKGRCSSFEMESIDSNS